MQESNVKKTQNHQLMIKDKKEVFLSGVESVIAFSPNRIALTLGDGTKVFIVGTGLKITAFSKDDGDFKGVGVVTGVSYGGKGFASKIFK